MSEAARIRMRHILHVLKENKIVQGLTPEKLKKILEGLGPTFIKFGQILSMRPDLIPPEYCDELAKLRSDVKPMPFSLVKDLIEAECKKNIDEVFQNIDPVPLGSASIGQVHKAVLKDGREVVVKIQRPKIKEIMKQDIFLCKKAMFIMKVVRPSGDAVDFIIVLDEMWEAAQREFDFLQEAANLEEFAERNKDIKYVSCPKVISQWTTTRMLMMEYIDGIPIDALDLLKILGYDLNEIGRKLAENYVKQVLEDAFFQADPHPGNICIRDGQIIWIDMGMMARLSDRDRQLFSNAVEAITFGDIYELKDTVLSLGVTHGKVDHNELYNDIDYIISKYARADFSGLNLGDIIKDIQEVLNKHRISIGRGMSMLIRGVITIEGVMAKISPDINFMEIFSSHMTKKEIKDLDISEEIKQNGVSALHLLKKTVNLPANVIDLIKMTVKGQTKVNIELSESAEFFAHLNEMINKLVIALIDVALLIGSSLICTTDMKGQFLGIPALGAVGFFFAIVLGLFLLWSIIKNRRK